MPWIFFRSNFESLAVPANEDTDDYKARVKLCDILGQDYQTIADAIYENPDIEYVAQSFMCFGVPINETSQTGLKYLYLFFDQMVKDYRYTPAIIQTGLGPVANPLASQGDDANTDDPANYRNIQLEDRDAMMTLTVGGIDESTFTTAPGIYKVNSYRFEKTSKSLTRLLDFDIVVDGTFHPAGKIFYDTVNVYTYTRQLTDTKAQSIIVEAPVISYRLTDQDGEHQRHAQLEGSDEVDSDGNSTDNSLLIPLNHTIAITHFNVMDRQQLYRESLHIVSNAYVKQRLEWYQTENFQILLAVIAVAIIIYSFGTATAQVASIYNFVLINITGIQIVAAILTAVIIVGIQYGLDKLFTYAAEELGSENTAIAAALTLLVSIGALATKNPNALKMLQISSGLVDAGTVQAEMEIAERQEDWDVIKELKDAELNVYQEIQDNFDLAKEFARKVGLTAMDRSVLNPEDFYQLSIHEGNIGTTTLDFVENFIEDALTLPDAFSSIS